MTDNNAEKPNVPTRGKAPVFLNGLTTHNTYLCIAVRPGEEQWNGVGVRRVGPDQYKLHFWPNAQFFGVEAGRTRYDRDYAGESHGTYEGSRGDWNYVEGLLGALTEKEGNVVAPLAKVKDVLEEGFTSTRHFTA